MEETKRNSSQLTGEVGESLVSYIASKNKDWIIRKVEKDFGIDLELELVKEGLVSGQYVKVQVKSSSKLNYIDATIPIRVKNKFLNYCQNCRIPILLVIADTESELMFFIWVQEFLRIHRINDLKGKSTLLKIPTTNDFEEGLKNNIKNIALRLNLTQIIMDLKASVESAFLLGDKEVYNKLVDISLDIAKSESEEINRVIEDIIALGNNAWASTEGNEKAQMLYGLCRKHGNVFTKSHIEKMVLRGFTYSRVGLNALGILYDDYPDYIKSLDLPLQFHNQFDERVRYYCLLRERYLGKKSFEIWRSQNIDYSIEKFYLDVDDREVVYLKYPNRGESTVLDYLSKEN